MNVLGLIPARGGSKGIPRKNLAALAGRPLIAYSCEAARRSKRLTRVIVSTDDPEIAATAGDLGIEVPFVRPSDISGDTTPMVVVMRHAVEACAADGWGADAVVLLQPTSPLRRAEHIDRAVDVLGETGAETVVSVVRVPHQFEPGSLLVQDEEGRLKPVAEGPLVLRRQDKPALFARNGPAVLAVRTELLLEDKLYGDVVRALEMSASESLDVDDPEDLALAEYWLAQRPWETGDR